ncbi:perlucin-like [Saccostrea cucullata]|uniref:perlucin-like n=1 Tax=Saccostrea cuccullata TaxID=36930 RepID=UPI002ED034A4
MRMISRIPLLSLVVATFSGIDYVGADCPNNWRGYSGNCYLFLTHLPMNWQSAWDYCAHMGAKLVEIETFAEDNFIKQNAKDFHFHDCFWLGGSDAVLPGVWIWATSRSHLLYTNWGPGEPNHIHSDNEHCLNLYYFTGYNTYFWNDDVCDYHCHPICEQPSIPGGSIFGRR